MVDGDAGSFSGSKGVESQLAALGAQKKKQERAVMLLQRESKKCEELQEGLAQLKRQKVELEWSTCLFFCLMKHMILRVFVYEFL